DAVGARVHVRGRNVRRRFVAQHYSALARLAEASVSFAANCGDRSRDRLHGKVGRVARLPDGRAKRDHPLDHFGLLAGNLARVNAAETLADHDDRLLEFLMGERQPRVQFPHRFARALGVRPDSRIDRAMAEPSAKVRQRRKRRVASQETRNKHEDFAVERLHAWPGMSKCAEPINAGLERNSELAQSVEHRGASGLYGDSRRSLRATWSHWSPFRAVRAGNVFIDRRMQGETATSSSCSSCNTT